MHKYRVNNTYIDWYVSFLTANIPPLGGVADWSIASIRGTVDLQYDMAREIEENIFGICSDNHWCSESVGAFALKRMYDGGPEGVHRETNGAKKEIVLLTECDFGSVEDKFEPIVGQLRARLIRGAFTYGLRKSKEGMRRISY